MDTEYLDSLLASLRNCAGELCTDRCVACAEADCKRELMAQAADALESLTDAYEAEHTPEHDDADLEMGFNPYAGCYDFDC